MRPRPACNENALEVTRDSVGAARAYCDNRGRIASAEAHCGNRGRTASAEAHCGCRRVAAAIGRHAKSHSANVALQTPVHHLDAANRQAPQTGEVATPRGLGPLHSPEPKAPRPDGSTVLRLTHTSPISRHDWRKPIPLRARQPDVGKGSADECSAA